MPLQVFSSGILRVICFYHLRQISTLYRWKHAPPVRTTFDQRFRDLISFVVKAAAYCIVKYALGDVMDKQCMIYFIIHICVFNMISSSYDSTHRDGNSTGKRMDR